MNYFIMRLLIIIFLFLCISELRADNRKISTSQNIYATIAERAFPAVTVIETYKFDRGKLKSIGTGSGFFITDSGYIVTNFHVIKNADLISVRLFNKNIYFAAIAGINKDIDLAILKIWSKKKLPYLIFADTRKVKIGHSTIAIGAPFELSHTMTKGIISHKGRLLGQNKKTEYIQTDAALNPGNSGGPLLNVHGKVIGVAACILTPEKSYSRNIGLGFAIDGNLAKKAAFEIIVKAKKNRSILGVICINSMNGATVIAKIKNLPNENSELRAGDIIISINSHNITDLSDFKSIIKNKKGGEKIIVEFIRNNKKYSTQLTLNSF